MTVFLAGLTTMVSSASNYRSHTIGIVGGFYAVSMILKIVGRMAAGWKWLTYTSFFTPFEPQLLVSPQGQGLDVLDAAGETPSNWGGWAMTAS